MKTARLWCALLIGLTLIIFPAYTSYAAGQVPIITSAVISNAYGTFPAAGNNGTTTTITINGVNLMGVTAVTVYQGNTSDPLISATKIVPDTTTPDTRFKVDIVIGSAAAAGVRNITVTTPFGTSLVATGVFTVYRATANVRSSGNISPGATFDVYINVNDVANLDVNQFDLIYDSSVIEIVGDEGGAGVSAGLIGQIIFPIDMWGYIPAGTPGQLRNLGNLPGVSGLCGQGYLTKITFQVVGAIGTSSPLTLPADDFMMFDGHGSRIIPDSVFNSSVDVTAFSINSTSMAEGTQGMTYSNSITATGGVTPYTWSATGLPDGLNITSSTGVVNGTPIVSGDFTVTISVKDSAGPVQNRVSQVFNLRIYSALQITTTSLPETVANVSYPNTTITFAGGKAPYNFNATGLPSGISLNSSTGVISGSTALSGSFNVIVTVSNSFLPLNSASKTLALKVYNALQITTATLPSGLQGNSYSANITAGGGKTPYAWSASGLPAGLTIGAYTGIISGTSATSGDFTINITAIDSFSPANISSVSLVLHIGQGVGILTTVLPDATQNINYPATALNAAGGISPYRWSASGLPTGLSLSTAGLITGMPTAVGNYSVVITVRDSSVTPLTQTSIYNIKIYSPLSIATASLPRWDTEVYSTSPPANWLPLPAPGWIAGQAYTANLTATGGKPNYIWSVSGLPQGLSISTGGVISGIPATSGLYSITFMVQDSLSPANFASKVLTIKIYRAGDADGDGQINMGDVTIVERVMLGLNPPTAGCDSNLNRVISIGDCTVIERIILGIQ